MTLALASLPRSPLGSDGHAVDFASWGPVEWVVYGAMALACVYVLWLAVRMTIHPGEEDSRHVKRAIFDDDSTPFGTSTPDGRPAAGPSADARDASARPDDPGDARSPRRA